MALLNSESTFNSSYDEVSASDNITFHNFSLNRNSTKEDTAVTRSIGYLELIVAVIGTPANLLVLFLTIKFLRRGARRPSNTPTERRHQSNLWFIFSMTLADYFFTAVHSPMMFVQYSLGVDYGEECLFLYIVTHTTTICSSISLLWLNLDKFLYLNQPLHYHARVTSRRALAAVICTWVTSVVWALFFMLGPFTKRTDICDFRPSHINWYTAFAVGFFVLPTAISLVISVYIACLVLRVMKENEARRRTGSIMYDRPLFGHRVSTNTTASTKAIVFVFTTTMWSAMTYLPYRIAYLLYISPLYPHIKSWWSKHFFYMLFGLMATNAAGNPIITILTQRQYSVGFMNMIGKRVPERSYSTTDAASVRRRRSSQMSRFTAASVRGWSKLELVVENKHSVSKF